MKRLLASTISLSLLLASCNPNPNVSDGTTIPTPIPIAPDSNWIRVFPFNDSNSNNLRDAGEEILQGTQFSITAVGGYASCFTGLLKPVTASPFFDTNGNCDFGASDLPNNSYFVQLRPILDTLPYGAVPQTPYFPQGTDLIQNPKTESVVLPFAKDLFRRYDVYWPVRFPSGTLPASSGHLRGILPTPFNLPNLKVTLDIGSDYHRETMTRPGGEFAIGHIPIIGTGAAYVRVWHGEETVYEASVNLSASAWTTLNATGMNVPSQAQSLSLKMCEDLDYNDICDFPDVGIDYSKKDRPLLGVAVNVQSSTINQKQKNGTEKGSTGNASIDIYGIKAEGEDTTVSIEPPLGFYCKQSGMGLPGVIKMANLLLKDDILCYPGGQVVLSAYEDRNGDGIQQSDEPIMNDLAFKFTYDRGGPTTLMGQGKLGVPFGMGSVELLENWATKDLNATDGQLKPGQSQAFEVSTRQNPAILRFGYGYVGTVRIQIFEDRDGTQDFSGGDSPWLKRKGRVTDTAPLVIGANYSTSAAWSARRERSPRCNVM